MAAVAQIPEMSGPVRKWISDAMAMQTRAMAEALDMTIDIPERELVVLSRT